MLNRAISDTDEESNEKPFIAWPGIGQVGGALAAIDALSEVVKAIKGRLPVLFDSGIRSGADMFKVHHALPPKLT